jgi:anti-sigma factor RsiW
MTVGEMQLLMNKNGLTMEAHNELLKRSFDEELTAEEQLVLNEALANSEALRNEKESLKKMRELIASSSASFSKDFADKVVDRIESEQVDHSSNDKFVKVFRSIALSGAAAIIALLLTVYYIDGSLSIENLFGISEYLPEAAEFSFFETQELD